MNTSARSFGHGYFPAIVCVERDSPIDALVALCVARDEAMDIVAASWVAAESSCLFATLDGGRPVVVLRTQEGRWAACNVFLSQVCVTSQEADRRLGKLLKRGRRGYVARLAVRITDAAGDG